MKTLKLLSIVFFASTTLSCSKEDEPIPVQTEKWVVSKEHITEGNNQTTGVYTYNSKGKPLQIKFYDGQNNLTDTEIYTYNLFNYLVKWERDYPNPNFIDTHYDIINDSQGRRIVEKFYKNNVLDHYDESTYGNNSITIVSKTPNGDLRETIYIHTDDSGNYLDITFDDNDPNTNNMSRIYSEYDSKKPLPRGGKYFGLLPYEILPCNPSRMIRKSGSSVTEDNRFEYQYNADGYVTVMKKYNNLDNGLISTTTFDLVKQ